MHWHQRRSQISQVFQVTSHVAGIFAVHFVSPIQLLSLYQFIQFLTCTRIPCRDLHCDNGLVRCCLYIAPRPGQTLQDFFAKENMAYADAVKAGFGIDPDRRAYHMFIKSGLTDDQSNHIFGFVYDSEAEGLGAALDPRKIQEVVLRFHDKPRDVDRHRDSRASMGWYSRPLMEKGQRRTVIRRRIIPGPGVATRAATCKSLGKKKLS